jgi:CheY-like chemotaxis protein
LVSRPRTEITFASGGHHGIACGLIGVDAREVRRDRLDGLTALAEMMVQRPVPVVMVSSLTHAGALTTLEALNLGAVDFVAKPGGTISLSIARLRELEGLLDNEGGQGRTKKELLQLTREREKLELSLGGIKDMGGIPDLMFVIDTNKEAIAIQEARKLNIPVVAILDTNCDPEGVAYPIPGNDDAARALQLYCDLIADSVLDGLAAGQASLGVDLGAAIAPVEPVLATVAAVEPATPVDPELEAAMGGAPADGSAEA